MRGRFICGGINLNVLSTYVDLTGYSFHNDDGHICTVDLRHSNIYTLLKINGIEVSLL